VVGPEPVQRPLDCDADARAAAVEDAGASIGVRDDAELRRQHDLVAAALDGPADQLLVVEGTVDLRGVEVGDAQVQRPVDGADGLGVAALSNVVKAGHGHGHGAESNPGDGESADRDVFRYWLRSPRLAGFWEIYSGSRFFASSQMRSKLGLNVK
jgi:hypothetical protein